MNGPIEMNGPIKRVMIFGQPGSGKSTLAHRLGELTGLPVVHMDKIHWLPGWVERPDAEKDQMCAEVHARDSWIFEGGRCSTWPERIDRADTIIWLDYPLMVRSFRVIRRTIKFYGRDRPCGQTGCPDQFNREFAGWIWNTRKSGFDRMLEFYQSVPENKRSYRLKNPRQVTKFIKEVQHSLAHSRN